MSCPAPRSIDEYLRQLRAVLADEDPALIQDALYDAEEYLRAEVAAHPDKSEADVLELIASTYGAPDEVAAAYRATEIQVKAALRSPVRPQTASPGALTRFFAVYSDPRAYTSLFFMLLTLATGVIYFTFAVTGLALSAGFSILIIGLPLFLVFIGMTRVIALGEGRLLEAVTGERMPRRPVHPGAPTSFWARIVAMITDPRTWTTLAYFLLMLPLGVTYFVMAVVGLSLGLSLLAVPFIAVADHFGAFESWHHIQPGPPDLGPDFLNGPVGYALCGVVGVLLLTGLMHLARGVGRVHARVAKSLLVTHSL